MIALGADNIVLGRKAELGPIDPRLETPFNPKDPDTKKRIPINVESVSAYVSLLKELVELRDEELIAKAFETLAKQAHPLALGEVYRQLKYIRMAASKIMRTRKNIDDESIEDIVETLVGKLYYHGHSISRKEAKELGLPVTEAPKELEDIMWNLYKDYELELKLNDPFYPEKILAQSRQDSYRITEKIVFVESTQKSDYCEVEVYINQIRQIPQNLTINVSFNVVAPTKEEQEELKQIVQKLLQQIMPQIYQQIQIEIRKQAPVIKLDTKIYENWRTISNV